jgi:hypothetical protein
MRVLCILKTLPRGANHHDLALDAIRWPVDVGREYEVFAISRSPLGVWHATFEHHEAEFPVDAPLALFEVTQADVSAHWRVVTNGGDLEAAGAIEFEDPLFVDDVQERREGAYERYQRMKERLGISRPHWRRQ